MAWTDLKAAIAAVIKSNEVQSITGPVMQSALNSIIEQVGADASFRGSAVPATNPGTPDGKVFYMASQSGVYPNFGGLTVRDAGFLFWNAANWSFISIDSFARLDVVSALNTLAGSPSFVEGVLASDGSVQASSAYVVFDYEKLGANGLTVFGHSTNSVCLCYFYDVNKNPLTGIIGAENDSRLISIPQSDFPDSAYYVRYTGIHGHSFISTEGVRSAIRGLARIAVTNVTISYPIPGYYTLATARAAIPVADRRAGHVLTFATALHTWSTYKYLGNENNNDTESGWNGEALWQKTATYDDITFLVEAEAESRSDADTDLSERLLKKAVTNVTISYPIPGYYTLATARAAIPVADRRAGHVLTFATALHTWSTYKYLGNENNNDTESGWNGEALWQKTATYDDITFLVEAEAESRSDADTALSERLLKKAVTNVTISYPIPGYYTLATARAAIPVADRRAGHVLTFATALHTWSTYKYLGNENNNDTESGWNGEALWQKTAAYDDITFLVEVEAESRSDADTALSERLDTVEASVQSLTKHIVDLSESTLTDGYVIYIADGSRVLDGTTSAASGYIDCKDAKSLVLSLTVGTTAATTGVAFYDENKVFISSVARDRGAATKKDIKNISVPANACFFRTTFFNTANRATYGDFTCFAYYGNSLEALGQEEICEYFEVSAANGAVTLSDTFGTSRKIYCGGATKLVHKVCNTIEASSAGTAFFKKDGTFISGSQFPEGVADYSTWEVLDIPSNADYFITSYWRLIDAEAHGLYSAFIMYPNGYLSQKGHRPKTSELIFFAPKINQAVNKFWLDNNELINADSYKETTGVLLLPDNYDPNGTPVPIIMYCHGWSHYVYRGTWGATTSFLTQKQNWAAKGYAVFDCNGARNNNRVGQFQGAGSAQFVNSYRETFEYIRKHYNVADRICVVAGSAGGPTGINFCRTYSNLVNKLALLSPWTDIKACAWDNTIRDSYVEYLGFTDDVTYEEEKAIGFDPRYLTLTIGTDKVITSYPVSVRAWRGSLEVGSALYTPLTNFISALRKGGNQASMREISGLSHSDVVSGANVVVDTEVLNYFNN